MTVLVMFFVIIASAVVQIATPGFAALAGANMPLLLGVVLYYALTRRRGAVLLAAMLAGFVQDSLSPVPFGYSALCFLVAGLLANRFRDEVFSESFFTSAVFGAAAAAGVTLVMGLLLLREGLIADSPGHILLKSAGSALLGAVFAPVVFWIARGLDRMVGNMPARQESFADEEVLYI